LNILSTSSKNHKFKQLLPGTMWKDKVINKAVMAWKRWTASSKNNATVLYFKARNLKKTLQE